MTVQSATQTEVQPVVKTRFWSGNYVLLLLGNFCIYVGFQMLVPTFTAYIKQLGGSNLSASLVYSLATACALIVRSVSGSAMDSIGRKPFLIAGMGVLVFINGAFFFTFNIPAILALRLIHGAGWGVAGTALATITADIVPADRRGEGIGYYALSTALATSFSIILGIWLMNYSGFRLALLASTGFFSVGLLLCQRVKISPVLQKKELLASKEPSWSTVFEKTALLPTFLCFLHSIAFSGIMAFIMLFGAESRIPNVWVFFAGHLAMVVISRPFAGKLFDRKGHAAVILPGASCLMAGLILMSYAHTGVSLFVASLFYGSGFGTVQPSLQAWAINRAPADRKGAASGTFLSSYDLGYTIGTVLMGLIASWTSYAFMYRISSLLLVFFLVVYCYTTNVKKSFFSRRPSR